MEIIFAIAPRLISGGSGDGRERAAARGGRPEEMALFCPRKAREEGGGGGDGGAGGGHVFGGAGFYGT